MSVLFRYPLIDLHATGKRIKELREQCGFSVRDLQDFLGLSAPQAIYKWQSGKDLPTLDNVFALSYLFQVPLDSIVVRQKTLPDNKSGSALFMEHLYPLAESFSKFGDQMITTAKRNGHIVGIMLR